MAFVNYLLDAALLGTETGLNQKHMSCPSPSQELGYTGP